MGDPVNHSVVFEVEFPNTAFVEHQNPYFSTCPLKPQVITSSTIEENLQALFKDAQVPT